AWRARPPCPLDHASFSTESGNVRCVQPTVRGVNEPLQRRTGWPAGEGVSYACRRDRGRGPTGSRIARLLGMRLVAGVLALSLFAPFARAEDTEDTRTADPAGPAGPAADVTYHKVPLRVVRIMAQSHQALLFDR